MRGKVGSEITSGTICVSSLENKKILIIKAVYFIKNSDLLDLVHNFVDINAVAVGFSFVVAISACVKQELVLLVFLRVEHVVALLKRMSICSLKDLTRRIMRKNKLT